MAWEISITAEGWRGIHDALEKWTMPELAAALGDYNYEIFHGTDAGDPPKPRHKGYWSAKKLAKLPHDILVNACYEAVEATNTCDNGGRFYWIDPDGCHKVELTGPNNHQS